MPTPPDFNRYLTELVELDTPRVWSLLVSIFGDLASEEDDRIDGPLLTRLTDGMNVKPEAVRVALHRLRNDGWITSHKSGRTASHALTQSALQARNAAAPMIYSAHNQIDDAWVLALVPNTFADAKSAITTAGFVPVAPRVYVGHSSAVAPKDVVVAAGQTVQDWFPEQIFSHEVAAEFETLLTVLSATRTGLGADPMLSPLQIAQLRCLIVHHWRRLVLRYPYLPPSLLGSDWAGHICRRCVIELLSLLPRPSLDTLSAELVTTVP